jgi:hypothetical protein
MFWPKVGDVKGDWRRLNNEEFYDLYLTTNVIRVNKASKMNWE